MKDLNSLKPLLLYTMTSGLGDFIVMGDLMIKIEELVPEARCFIAHRGNPHVSLWRKDDYSKRFYDVYKPSQFFKLITSLKRARKEGYTGFGLQMAPGSLQGFLFHTFLKKIKSIDFTVDFNLINADIITSPKGNYILDLHLNQIKDLLKIDIPEDSYRLVLPTGNEDLDNQTNNNRKRIGIHPWSRRGDLPSFAWPFENWLEAIKFLLDRKELEIVIFGKDGKFEDFRAYIYERVNPSSRIKFIPCNSVKELITIVKSLNLLLSVNTSVVHIGYALGKKMIILSGPSLDLWTPRGENIIIINDDKAVFSGSDKYINDARFPSVSKIAPKSLLSSISLILGKQ